MYRTACVTVYMPYAACVCAALFTLGLITCLVLMALAHVARRRTVRRWLRRGSCEVRKRIEVERVRGQTEQMHVFDVG